MEENAQAATGADVPNAQHVQETFQRAQAGRTSDRRYPGNPPGVVPVPRGSKGPRSLYLRRYGDSFGFTLRHLIVYPPESIAEDDGRHAACGALLAPMETIFVRQVRNGTAAQQAGLQRGDRLVAVNNVATAGRSYQQVVQLISNSPEYLHLLVVPKEEDVLQRFFPDSAYNPLSNQDVYADGAPLDRATAQHFLTQQIVQSAAAAAPQEFRVDAASWFYLQQPHLLAVPRNRRADVGRGAHQRSADTARSRAPLAPHQEIYAEIRRPNEVHFRQKSRAQPQVPLYRKMGRRASEGSNLLASADCSATSLTSSDGDCGHYGESMRAMQNDPHGLPSSGDPRNDAVRRESTSSLASSVADSSKDSLASFGSNSTLTGHEIDDSVRISRVRQSVRQKEEFLRTPVFREFHGRPKKLERPVWPPSDATVDFRPNGGVAKAATPLVDAQLPRHDPPLAEMAPSFDAGETSRQSVAEARRSVINYILAYLFPMMNAHPHFQNVQKKAKEFESYPVDASRRNFTRSELARLSKKVLLPNVNERAHEYEVRTSAKESPTGAAAAAAPLTSTTSQTNVKRIQRDSRSLDSSGRLTPIRVERQHCISFLLSAIVR
uniref:PDZ domain-containing protein n=1 Tax=Dendroctonus ponderosae TaxID=77166 RepID=A0AAR5PNQ3_DENPD